LRAPASEAREKEKSGGELTEEGGFGSGDDTERNDSEAKRRLDGLPLSDHDRPVVRADDQVEFAKANRAEFTDDRVPTRRRKLSGRHSLDDVL